MKIFFTTRFKKNFKKRISNSPKLNKKFQERLNLFLSFPNHPLLRSHSPKGAKKELSSSSITGDIRVVYRAEKDEIFLLDIGSHNQVY